MRVVVPIGRVGLAVGTEVGVMADSTLVSDAFNVGKPILVFAERTITEDAVVAIAAAYRLSQRLIDGNEAVRRVDELGALDALGAEVPVGAVQALVAHTVNELLAAIADGRVADIAASIAQEVGKSGHRSLFSGSLESMARVVAVLVVDVALHAEVVVFACGARNKLALMQD
jgi:hypothetical protein